MLNESISSPRTKPLTIRLPVELMELIEAHRLSLMPRFCGAHVSTTKALLHLVQLGLDFQSQATEGEAS
jgi:hypothetical protein